MINRAKTNCMDSLRLFPSIPSLFYLSICSSVFLYLLPPRPSFRLSPPSVSVCSSLSATAYLRLSFCLSPRPSICLSVLLSFSVCPLLVPLSIPQSTRPSVSTCSSVPFYLPPPLPPSFFLAVFPSAPAPICLARHRSVFTLSLDRSPSDDTALPGEDDQV